jgi:hypothetical protein
MPTRTASAPPTLKQIEPVQFSRRACQAVQSRLRSRRLSGCRFSSWLEHPGNRDARQSPWVSLKVVPRAPAVASFASERTLVDRAHRCNAVGRHHSGDDNQRLHKEHMVRFGIQHAILCKIEDGKHLRFIPGPISRFHHVWPVAGLIGALIVNLVWMGFLGYGFFRLVEPAFF